MFGNMKKQPAVMEVTITVVIAGRNCTITCDAIDGSLPLLLSKKAMKKAGFLLNLASDTLTVFGKRIKLETTVSAHYLLRLLQPGSVNSVLVTTRGETDKIDVKKLHLQFAHCSANAL